MKRFNSVLTGMIAGLIGPVPGFFLYYVFLREEPSIKAFWNIALQQLNTPKVMVMSLLFNLLVFFTFIWTDRLKGAQGVILATVLWGLAIVYLKFLR